MAITNKQIAARLGVSPATVSFVLNNKPGISEATRRRVFAAFDELGYSERRARGAAFSASSISFIVYKKHGKVVSDTPFFSQLIEGLQEQCGSHGCHLNILYVNGGAESALGASLPPDCAGVIVLATEMASADIVTFKDLKVPFLVLDSNFVTGDFDTVVIDNIQGAYAAVNHLIEAGHKKIGHVRSSFAINNFAERHEGFVRALRDSKIETGSAYDIFVEPTMDGAYRDMCLLLRQNTALPTAYFADNDIIATGCIRALKESGAKIPEDISIIGFDDMPMCEATDPPLSTVRVPKQRMGMLAVDRLAMRMDKKTAETVGIAVKTTLIARGSVAKKLKYNLK